MKTERADVLVIGSGAAGGAVATRLSAHGASVVCLEQGDWVKPAEYPSTKPDWEVQLRRGRWNFSPNVRRLPEDYPVVPAGKDPPDVLMFNAVGGSTIHWTGHFPRFHPSDFRVRTLDGVADDWPITYDDLAPYYDVNDQNIGVSGISGDPCNPPRQRRPTAPLPLGVLGETIARACDKLGWYWWVSDNAIVSERFGGRPACTLQGRCMMGCPIGAKASTDVTHWPKAIKQGAVLKTRARVREISVDANGRARGAIYYDRDGKTHEALARVVVVCCNGIGTPRLLLNSKSKHFPDGLANSSGLVGKNFMIHPFRFLEGIFDERMDGWLGPFGIPAFSQHFYETDVSRGFVRGYSFQFERSFGPMHQALGGFTTDPVPWGKDHHRVMRERFGHVLRVTLMGEDLPEEHNRVTLDPDRKDSDGIPAARVSYSYSENSLRIQEHAREMATRLLKAAGARTVLDGGVIQPAFHLMGTARMGDDPKTSVVNRWNQAHDVKNLFIVDGSSFVTGAAVNPTSDNRGAGRSYRRRGVGPPGRVAVIGWNRALLDGAFPRSLFSAARVELVTEETTNCFRSSVFTPRVCDVKKALNERMSEIYSFEIGQLVQHRRYGYRGVVAGRDRECQAPEDWYQSNRTQPDRSQPWYHVLVHGGEHTTYAAEDGLEEDHGGEQVVHPLTKAIFEFFHSGRYTIRQGVRFPDWS